MRGASHLVSFAFAVSTTLIGAAAVKAHPVVVQQPFAAQQSAFAKVGYDCTYDYCPPRPQWRYRGPIGRGSVTIHNNYGTVNIYENRPHRGSWLRPWPEERPADVGSACREPPCETHCDTACWLRRYKEGYCGHGCDFYRRKIWYERGVRLVPYPRPVYSYSEPGYAPCAEGDPCSGPAPQYEPPPPAALVPRRRFEGPRYPPDCRGPDC